MRTLLVIVVLAACGGGTKSAPATGPISNQEPVAMKGEAPPATDADLDCAMRDSSCMVDMMARFKDRMCKCAEHDTACGNAELERMKVWAEDMAKRSDMDQKPDPELAKKLEPIMAEYTRCVTRVLTPALPDPCGGSPDPCGGH